MLERSYFRLYCKNESHRPLLTSATIHIKAAATINKVKQKTDSAALHTTKAKKMPKIYQLKVTGISGEMKIIDLCSTEEDWRKMTVLHLREKIEERFSGEFPGDNETQR